MTNWDTHSLGELVKAGGGKIHTGPFGSQLHASDYVSSGIPCIMPANMKDNRVDLSDIAYISEQDATRLSKYLVKAGDIVYSRRGDVTLKALIREEEEGYFCGTGCLLVRPGSEIAPEFLAYYLSTSSIKNWIVKQAVGATMPNLNTGILERIPFTGPKKAEQQKLSAAIASIDKKIELNNKINAELEAMAKFIYDYWFVQFDFPDANGKPYKSSGGKMDYNEALKREIPDGWEARPISDLLDIKTGKKDANHATDNGKYHFFTCGDKALRCDDFEFDGKSILLAGNGNFNVKKYNGKFNAYQRTYVLIPENKNHYGLVFYAVQGKVEQLTKGSRGSIVKFITKGDIEDIHIAMPQNDNNYFYGIFNATFDKTDVIYRENQKLIALRDWLLPMLMNGQVTVR